MIAHHFYPQPQKAFIMLKKILLAAALSAAFASPTALANSNQMKKNNVAEFVDFVCFMKGTGDSITFLALYNGASEKEALAQQTRFISNLNKNLNKKNHKNGGTEVLRDIPKLVKSMLVSPKDMKTLVKKVKASGVSRDEFSEELKTTSQTECTKNLNSAWSNKN